MLLSSNNKIRFLVFLPVRIYLAFTLFWLFSFLSEFVIYRNIEKKKLLYFSPAFYRWAATFQFYRTLSSAATYFSSTLHILSHTSSSVQLLLLCGKRSLSNFTLCCLLFIISKNIAQFFTPSEKGRKSFHYAFSNCTQNTLSKNLMTTYVTWVA